MSRILYARAPLLHGPWWPAWTDDGVCAGADCDWDEKRFVEFLREHHDGEIEPGDPADVPDAIDLRFVRGDFRRDVLRACAAIPEGQARTHGEPVAAVGRPRAARAVGTAMARTRFRRLCRVTASCAATGVSATTGREAPPGRSRC